MKVERESLLGAVAVLGLALVVAYLGPDQDRPHPSRSRSTSDESASADDAFAPGRGRHAVSPGRIPAKGWKDILWRTYEQSGNLECQWRHESYHRRIKRCL